MSNYIIGQQPSNNYLSFNSDKNKLELITSGNTISVGGSSEGITPLNTIEVVGSTVKLDNKYNTYLIKPTSTINLVFDNSEVKEFTGGEFYLMLDFTDGVKTVNFPETFKWKDGTTAPTINSNNLYLFKCLYLYTDPVAYVGEVVTSVVNQDFDKGIWSFNQETGELDNEYTGTEYVDDLIVKNDQKVVINSGLVGRLSIALYSDFTDTGIETYSRGILIVNGGTINSLGEFLSEDNATYWEGTSINISFNNAVLGIINCGNYQVGASYSFYSIEANNCSINSLSITSDMCFGYSSFVDNVLNNCSIERISVRNEASEISLVGSSVNTIYLDYYGGYITADSSNITNIIVECNYDLIFLGLTLKGCLVDKLTLDTNLSTGEFNYYLPEVFNIKNSEIKSVSVDDYLDKSPSGYYQLNISDNSRLYMTQSTRDRLNITIDDTSEIFITGD